MIRIFTLIVLALTSPSQAAECVVDSINFPNSNCSFSPPFEAHQLKFGNLDAVFASGNSIRIGAARFDLADNVEIFDAADPACNYDYDELASSDEGQEIAFKVNETNTREITHVWLLDCTEDLAR